MEISGIDDSDRLDSWQMPGKKTLAIGAALVALAGGVGCSAGRRKARLQVTPLSAPAVEETAPPEVEVQELSFKVANTKERESIDYILKTTAEADLSSFWAAAGFAGTGIHLKNLGTSLQHLHPFAFILAAPKQHVHTIVQKKNCKVDVKGPTIQGMIDGLKEKHKENDLLPHVPDLARKMGKEAVEIERLINDTKWIELIAYLFEIEDIALLRVK